MYDLCFVTYYQPGAQPHRRPYIPPFFGDGDGVNDVTALNRWPDPNAIVFAGRVSADNLAAWLTDGEIMILWYEEVIDEQIQ